MARPEREAGLRQDTLRPRRHSHPGSRHRGWRRTQGEEPPHFSGRSNHLAAEVEHHLLDEHRDHRLVLDDENSTPWLISHALPPLKGPRPRLTATITPEFLGRASAGALPRPTDPAAPSGSFFFSSQR